MEAQSIPSEFSRHLVAWGCWDRTPEVLAANEGKPYLRSFSGFVISIRGTSWSVMTAGHVIEDIRELVRLGHDLYDWYVDDSPIQRPPEGLPVPLSWDIESVGHLHNEAKGFDFALIPLAPLEQAALESNKVRPITEVEIADPYAEDFDRWYLLGLPDATARPDHQRQVVAKNFFGLPVDPLPRRPEWWDTESNPEFEMKYGMLMPIGDEDIDGLDIAGMSGGPIIGLRETEDGTGEWKVIGIQSGWMKGRRAISFFFRQGSFRLRWQDD
ncbi:hypothetical protein [Burkholderia ubonensis]|nr:hypothetical protein [Burkholderia ubonensis]